MVMGYIWTGMVLCSILSAIHLGTGGGLAGGAMEGAQEGIRLAFSMGGSLCLWTGVGALLEKGGVTGLMARLFSPFLFRLFPTSKKDPALAGALGGNLAANLLGLGNAATPMGIRAAKLLNAQGSVDELCRLVVLNTASIQLIPATVASLRAAAGCETPFDILPAVWLTSLLALAAGLGMAALLRRLPRFRKDRP